MGRTDIATPREWLVGGGELGALIRAKDWAATAMGPRARWPQSLRTAVCLVVESRTAMALVWGPALLLLYNDAYREIAADRHPDALGCSTREVWPEVWHVNAPIFDAVMARGETAYFEDRPFSINRRGFREDAYFTLGYGPVRVEDGSIGGTLVTLYETTARVRSERTLLEAQRLANIGNWEWDIKTGAMRWSPQLYAIYGRSPDHFVPCVDSFRTLVHPDDRARVEATIRAVVSTGAPVELEYRIVTPEGATRTLLRKGALAWVDADGTPRVMMGVEQDITERKAAEEALRNFGDRFALALRAVRQVGIWDWDLETDAVYYSPRYKQMLGYTEDEIEPHVSAWKRLLHPDDLARVLQATAELTRGERDYELEFRMRHKDGHYVDVLSRGLPVRRESDGKIVRIVGTHLDITERKRAEAALLEADRRKNEFISVLSHELRNPLAPIRNSLYLLERVAPGSEQARRALAIIGRQVDHLARLVDDLLDVARMSSGKVVLQRERLELCELVRRTVEDHRAAFVTAEIVLELVTTSREVWVDGDRTRLAQILGNLLHNAAKFTPKGGHASVTVGADGVRGEATIRVEDSGRGIAPERLPHLFEPFTQADTTLDRTMGGLGLGLAVVKGLVEMHGGTVIAQSAGRGQGATFTITLPLARAPAPSS